MSNRSPYVGFDLDGTLAHYDKWQGPGHIGAPIPATVSLVRRVHDAAIPIRVITARASTLHPAKDIEAFVGAWYAWARDHLDFLPYVPHTQAAKCMAMIALVDDRAIAVEKNTGRILGGDLSFLPPQMVTPGRRPRRK